MRIFESTIEPAPFDGTALTVGTFDGLHLGHRKIIAKVKEQAQRLGIQSLVFTFEPHPKIVVHSAGKPDIRLLTTFEEKIKELDATGLDSLVVSQFTTSFAATSAEDFVRDTLVNKLKMKSIIIGHDHAFGRNREGNYELLQKLGRELHFDVHTVAPISVEGDHVSSTRIRRAISDGQVELAAKLLGRPYLVQGLVVEGEKLGRQLGFPTANLRPASPYKLIPKAGIYATTVSINNRLHNSVTYIGAKPTFNGGNSVVEVHVHDFDADLYGKELTVYFYTFLRDDRKFVSTDELIKTIKQDKENATKYFVYGGQL